MNDYDNLWDPALVQQMVALGGIPDQQAMAMRRMETGREAARAAMPRGYQVGNTYMAASPMEHLAAALEKGMGVARERRAETEYGNLLGQQTAGRNAYATTLARLLQQNQTPTTEAGPITAPVLMK